MRPNTQIQLPAAVQERIDDFRKQEWAGRAATEALMRSGMVDYSGNETTLLDISTSIGNASAIGDAAYDVFMALTTAGMTYREFNRKKESAATDQPAAVERAVRHFYYVITNSRDMQSIGMGRGELFLIPLDWHIARYLKARETGADTPARMAS